MRKHGRTDANQTKVVEHLRAAGLSVWITSSLGGGFPDLVVAGSSPSNFVFTIKKTVLVELKDPRKPPSKRKLTNEEENFFRTWKGEKIIATSAEEILELFQTK